MKIFFVENLALKIDKKKRDSIFHKLKLSAFLDYGEANNSWENTIVKLRPETAPCVSCNVPLRIRTILRLKIQTFLQLSVC